MKKIIVALLSLMCLTSVGAMAACTDESTPKDNSSNSVTVAEYEVTFVGGEGATGNAVVKKAKDGANITLPENTFSKEGYEFKCWNDGTKDYQAGALYKVEGEKTFTAVWQKKLVDFVVSAYPTASVITYGQKLSESTLSGGQANIEGSFVWVAPDTVPTVSNGGFNVKFVPTDSDYAEVVLEDKVAVTVNKKAVTEIELPTATAISYGDAVGVSQLSGGAAYCTFAWENPDEVATACGNKEATVVITPNDENYDFSGATLTGKVNVEVNKKALKVKAIAILAYGDEVPTIDAYEITYDGFIFEDDASVVTGSAKLGETTYEKGAEGSIFYGELDVSEMSAENYEMQSMGADILLRVKLAFKAGGNTLYDYCEFGEQYQFKAEHDGLSDYVIDGYVRGENTYQVGDKLVVDAWAQEPFAVNLAVALAPEEVVFSTGAKLYYGLGDSTSYFNATTATLHYIGAYPNSIEWLYYRATMLGVDYRNYNGLSFQIASNVALKLYMTDGSELLTLVGGQAYVFTVQKDGSLYIDGVDSGKDFVNGTIAFDMDRSASIYAELHVAKTMTANGSESISFAKENLLIYGIQSVGNMFAGKNTQDYAPQATETGFANIGYQSQDIRKVTLNETQKDLEIAYYYEFAINNPKVNAFAHDYTSFYIGMNQGYHDLYCGGKFLATITSHQQIKISIDGNGTVYLDDVSTGFAVDSAVVKFNVYLNSYDNWVSPYTTFYASNKVSVEDYEVTAISAALQPSATVYTSTSLEEVKALLVAKAQYDNGSEREISDYELSGDISLGESVLTLFYKGKTATVTINVAAVELASIEATYVQSGTVYKTTALDDLKADLVVKKIFNDGSEEIAEEYTLDGSLTAGESTVTVTCGGKTASFTVVVTKVQTSVSATYTQGEEKIYANTPLDALKKNLVVKAQFDNDTEEEVTDYALSGELAAGESVITVTHNGKTTTFTVNVSTVELTGITAAYTQGEKVVYASASLEALKGDLVVTAAYSDGTSKAVTEYELSGSLAAGESTVTVTHNGKTATFTVNVTAVEVVSISAEYTQAADIYKSTALDSLKTDLVVTATYNDGSSAAITEYELSGTLTVGDSTVTVTVGEATDTFTVIVSAEVISLAKADITLTAGSKLYYGIGTMAAGSETPFNALQASLQYSGSGNVGVQTVHAYYRALLKGIDYRNYTSFSFNVSSNVANLKLFTVDGTQILATLAKTAHKITVMQDGSLYVDGVDTGKDMANGAITFDIDRSVNPYAVFYLSTATEAVGGTAVTLAKENLFITGIENVGKAFERKYIDAATPEKDTEANIGYKMDSVKEISVGGTNLPASYYELTIAKTAVDYTKYDSVTIYLSINQGGYHELYCGGEKLGTFSASHTQKKVTVMKDGTVYVDDVKTNAKLSGGELKFNILLVAEQEHLPSPYTQFKISDKVVTE